MTRSQIFGAIDDFRSPSWRRLALVGLVLPLVAATVLVWATTGRPQNLDRVPVAVVNNDQIIQKPQPMAAGRALAAALTEPSSDQTNLDWTLANPNDAATGLKDGDYYAVLTIPQDFSKAILSTGTDNPMQGKLKLVSNGASSATVPFISQAIAAQAATSLGQQSTQGYLVQVYDGFNQIASSNKQAASSAGQLTQGTAQVSQGAKQVGSGAGTLATGLGQLASGAQQLAQGTASLRSGADSLATGADAVAGGANELTSGSNALATGAQTLAGKEAGFTRAARAVAAGSARVADGAKKLSLGSRAIAVNLLVLTRVCQRSGASDRFCNALARAQDRAGRVAQASVAVAAGSAAAARADQGLATGAGELATGSHQLAGAANALHSAAARVSSGADKVSNGASSLAQGATETDQAAGQLASGATSSAQAGNQLASGSASLSSGATSTNQGAQQLSQGLDQLASQSPTYSKQEKQALTIVVSEPVKMNASVENTDHGNGWLLGVVLGVVLWLAALLGVLRRDLAPVLRNSTTPVSSRRLTMVQLRPATGIALLQGAAVLLALVLVQVHASSPVVFSLLTLLAAATFTLVGVCLRWAFGSAGILAFVLLLLLQAAALGNVLPIETAPAPLPLLNRVLPLTSYVNATSQLVAGGSAGSIARVVTVLLLWGGASCLLALLVVRYRRVERRSVAAVG